MLPTPSHTAHTKPATALMLSGGGARAAYQVGVLEAMADLRNLQVRFTAATLFPF